MMVDFMLEANKKIDDLNNVTKKKKEISDPLSRLNKSEKMFTFLTRFL